MAAPISAGELADAVIDALRIRPSTDRQTGATALAEEFDWPTKAVGRINVWFSDPKKKRPTYDETWDMLAALGLLPTDREGALELLAQVVRTGRPRRTPP